MSSKNKIKSNPLIETDINEKSINDSINIQNVTSIDDKNILLGNSCGKIELEKFDNFDDNPQNQTDSLKSHKDNPKMFSQTNSGDFQCSNCNYTATQKANLIRHISTVHNKIKQFQCEFCDSSFGQKAHLETHIKRKH